MTRDVPRRPGRMRSWRRRIGLAVAAVLAAFVAAGRAAAVALGADPTPAAGGGDVRTNPAAPGLVGDPLFAIGGVLLVALVAVALTLLALRLSARR